MSHLTQVPDTSLMARVCVKIPANVLLLPYKDKYGASQIKSNFSYLHVVSAVAVTKTALLIKID